jgi:2-iminobutanoate/2-iminopropanoate deaminase
MTTHHFLRAFASAATVGFLAVAAAPAHARGQSANDSIRFINPPTLSSAPRIASKLVEIPPGSRLIYISGLVGNDANGKVVGPGDMHAQAKQVFENVRLALAAAGGTFKDVVKLNFYLTDMSRADEVRAVRAQYINADAPPASTLVEVSKLAAPEYMVEIEAVAAIVPSQK